MKRKRRKTEPPKGWTARQVAAELAYYDRQSDAEAAAEIEAGFEKGAAAIVVVPRKLLPAVRELLASAG